MAYFIFACGLRVTTHFEALADTLEVEKLNTFQSQACSAKLQILITLCTTCSFWQSNQVILPQHKTTP